MANVQVVRLISGEEIICEVSYNNGEYTLKNPLRIMMNIDRNNQNRVNLGFADWLPYFEDNTFVIKKEHVLFVAKPQKDMITQYTATFSGIMQPTAPKIIVP